MLHKKLKLKKDKYYEIRDIIESNGGISFQVLSVVSNNALDIRIVGVATKDNLFFCIGKFAKLFAMVKATPYYSPETPVFINLKTGEVGTFNKNVRKKPGVYLQEVKL